MTRTANSSYHARYSQTAMSEPHLTLYFLQASRSIRIAWALEELSLPYTLKFANRQQQKAPPEFKTESGGALGKFPCIRDAQPSGDDIIIHESGAILEYLLDNYDKGGRLMPSVETHRYMRSQVQVFVHAAEGALMLHALAILYFRWQVPASFRESEEGKRVMEETEGKMAVNVVNDLEWLERELGSSSGMFLMGNTVTAADVMMYFSVEFTVERELGVKKEDFKGRFPKLSEWLERCRRTEGHERAVEKSGYTLYPTTT